MVTVLVTRHALESDPLEVIADARKQAVAEREARRLGLEFDYQQHDDFIELHVKGQAGEKMRDFLTALRGFGITGCTLDVDAAIAVELVVPGPRRVALEQRWGEREQGRAPIRIHLRLEGGIRVGAAGLAQGARRLVAGGRRGAGEVDVVGLLRAVDRP